MINIQNIYKSYHLGEHEIKALQGIDLKMKQGEFFSILGPSGSGKSTLLNLIGGLDRPDRGKILFNEQDLGKMNDQELSHYRNHHIGFVFQTFNLIPHRTALENVVLPLIFNNTPVQEREEIAMKALEKVNLVERAEHNPAKLSGGERQRLAIARALVSEPDVILADEPTGNLDSKSGADILDLLLQLNTTDKVSLIVVTHEDWVAKKANRILKMHDGKLS